MKCLNPDCRLVRDAALLVGEEPTISYEFFVDDKPYTTRHRTLNAMEIKHVTGVPLGWRLGHDIVRKFRDGKPLFLSDDRPIDLSGDPKRFYSVPHAYASGVERLVGMLAASEAGIGDARFHALARPPQSPRRKGRRQRSKIFSRLIFW
jgi:hypothetical protein